MKRFLTPYAVVLALIAASPALAQTGSSATPTSTNGYSSSGTSTGSMPSSPLGYLAIGGSAALFGGLWLTRRHKARGQVSW
jgi:hypothetical protein